MAQHSGAPQTGDNAGVHGAHDVQGVHGLHDAAHADNHGSTPAAWTAVTVILIGFIVGAVGLLMASAMLFWVGIALVLGGGVIGYVMSLLGFGGRRREHPEVPATKAPDLP
jgi:hypothetical protein